MRVRKYISCLFIALIATLRMHAQQTEEKQFAPDSIPVIRVMDITPRIGMKGDFVWPVQLPAKYLDKVDAKTDLINQKLNAKSKKILTRFQKEEARLRKKLQKVDSIAAKNIFFNSIESYKQLEAKLKNPGKLVNYIPRLDTVITSFKFLEQNTQLLSEIKDSKEKLSQSISKIKELESQLQISEDIKQFLKERRQLLKEQLQKFGLTQKLKKINKEVYYYSQQVKEYVEMFNDPKKIEKKAFALLSRSKLFKDFMKKNSMLSSLFPMPPGVNSSQANQAGFASLQTRGQLNSFVQQTGLGASNLAQLQQNVQNAMSQVTQLREKINSTIGASGNELEMPDFKPNNQKTKSFFRRLEYGTNFQSQGSRNYLPVTSDLGMSVGYKLNDKSVIGIGASYKLGWGTGWNNIRISHQGVGLRSFVDWKINNLFLVSGGYEQNYRAEFTRIARLRDLNAWQQSGLVGISKVFSLKTKLFKQAKMQLLWDFLSYQQRPQTQQVLFRVGYNF